MRYGPIAGLLLHVVTLPQDKGKTEQEESWVITNRTRLAESLLSVIEANPNLEEDKSRLFQGLIYIGQYCARMGDRRPYPYELNTLFTSMPRPLLLFSYRVHCYTSK